MRRSYCLPLALISFALVLSACAPRPTQLSDLPRTPQASVEQILKDADRRSGVEANLLRLHAAQAALNAGQPERVQQILAQIPQSELPADQQIRFISLQAQSALALDQVRVALQAIRHPSIQQLDSQPLADQIAIHKLRANVLEASGDRVAAVRERIYVDGLLSGSDQRNNRLAIWEILEHMDSAALRQAADDADGELAGWLELILASREAGSLDLQVSRIQRWQQANPDHPANQPLPASIRQRLELYAQRPQHIGLLLPFQGSLAGPAQALRDGFLSAQYQIQEQGLPQPRVSLYDSTQYADLNQFYRQAKIDGVQWVIGPLERDKVTQLAQMKPLPLPTLALNYTDVDVSGQDDLFQFGLAPEDEARSAAQAAWLQGYRSMAVVQSQGDWAERSYAAFEQAWQELGGQLLGREVIDQPVDMAGQIGSLLRIRQSEQRGQRIQRLLGNSVVVQPAPRADLDALFVAITPQQGRQLKPILAFQYAADLPVMATSHVFQPGSDPADNLDLEGVLVAETPWLLHQTDALYQPVVDSWPQASGALGRLFAMGVDAQRIFTLLPQMQLDQSTRLEGATGVLTLKADGRISRQVPWGIVHDGQLSEWKPLTVEQ
ncbi:penicillin-binding protein activator [Halopseudomonas salegens]|uniref:Penicillin-binding protein activator n=1 Tax=Halopseudomonas salegens TaxID=1434072 RepID=A0A1H2GT92_9GAMM|nr:penicillin-binding protein activator [Halopseudomonas salegens]SDU22518.1 hypothetical protein SAMN05216210_2515 [Halopseudomonas salegens]